MVFAEPDEGSGLKVLERLASGPLKDNVQFNEALDALRPDLDRDGLLAKTMSKYLVVLSYYFSDTDQSGGLRVGKLPTPVFGAGHFKGRKNPILDRSGFMVQILKYCKMRP